MSIQQILDLFASKHNMDYSADFDTIKSVLDFCNENVKPLNKIQFKGGNDEPIKVIVSRLQKKFEEKGYLIKTEHESLEKPECNLQCDTELRKVTFFLILNTDATYPYDLKEDNKISHVIGFVPELPKCLLIHILWGLNLDKYFFECIRYCPIWFSCQFIEPATASLKHLEVYDGLDKVKKLLESMLYNAARLETRSIEKVAKKRFLAKYFDYTMDLLRQFYTPDMEKFTGWSNRKRYKFLGYCILYLVKMCLYSFDLFERKVNLKTNEEYKNIFEICTDKCALIKSENIYSEDVTEHLRQIAMCLLNSLQFNVMSVTVEIFIYWAEFDLTDKLTLQAEIGQKAFHISERIQKNNALNHDIISVLQMISLIPKNIEDEVKEATLGQILNKLDEEDESGEKQLWFDELINRGELVFDNEECVNAIKENAKLVTPKTVSSLLEYLSENRSRQVSDEEIMDVDQDDDELKKSIVAVMYESLKNFDKSQLEEIIFNEIRIFGLEVNLLEQPDFTQRSVEFFNKSTENFDTTVFLRLCAENPSDTLTRFFGEACQAEQQLKNFTKMVDDCKSVFSQYNSSLVCDLYAEKIFEKYYPQAIAAIFKADNVDNLYRSFFYSNIKVLLADNLLDNLLVMVKTLFVIADESKRENCFGQSAMPLLIITAKILEQCRWDLVTYNPIKNEIVDQTIHLIRMIIKKSKPSVNDKLWVKEKSTALSPLTTFYLQPVISDEMESFFDYQQKRSSEGLELKTFLMMLVVRCNINEMELIAENKEVLKYFHKVIQALLKLVHDFDKNADNNIRHCVMGYANVLNKHYQKMITSENNESEIDKNAATDLAFSTLNLMKRADDIIEESIAVEYQTVLMKILEFAKPLSKDDANGMMEILEEKSSNAFEAFKERLKLELFPVETT